MQSISTVLSDIESKYHIANKAEIQEHFANGGKAEVYYTEIWNKIEVDTIEGLRNAYPYNCDMCNQAMRIMKINIAPDKQYLSVCCQNSPCVTRRIKMQGDHLHNEHEKLMQKQRDRRRKEQQDKTESADKR